VSSIQAIVMLLICEFLPYVEDGRTPHMMSPCSESEGASSKEEADWRERWHVRRIEAAVPALRRNAP